MVDFNQKSDVGNITTTYDLYVAGTKLELNQVIFNEATAGYTPAVGDILCINTLDANKHQRYDDTDKANLVINGVIDSIESDNTEPANQIINYTLLATVHYAALGADNVATAAAKLDLIQRLRAINVDVDATDAE